MAEADVAVGGLRLEFALRGSPFAVVAADGLQLDVGDVRAGEVRLLARDGLVAVGVDLVVAEVNDEQGG